VSGWLRSTTAAKELARDGAAAIAAATSAPGAVATLVIPADCQWDEADGPAPPVPASPAPRVPADRIESIAEALRDAENGALFLGGRALREPGLRAAARVATAVGARLLCETFPARIERGRGLPAVERLPYFPEQAIETLAGLRPLVRAGATDPVAFFGYPGVPSRLAAPDAEPLVLAEPGEDVVAALNDLADALDAPVDAPAAPDPQRPETPSGALDPGTLGVALAAAQPEGAIVVDEAATSGLPWFVTAQGAAPHTTLSLTGGAIGQGLPCATGAALACPDRRVIAFQADGSGAYTLQSLWTQAREGLDVTTIVCANRAYRILQVELARAGIAEPGPKARALTDLSHPALDWVSLARGLGVPGTRVENTDSLVAALDAALTASGPQLIEVLL
jgi:acetolactate synthase-1/2/3 large subunit